MQAIVDRRGKHAAPCKTPRVMNVLDRDPFVTNEQLRRDLHRSAAAATCCWQSATQVVGHEQALAAAECALRQAQSSLSPVDLVRRLTSRTFVRMVGAQLRREVVYWLLWSAPDQRAWIAVENLPSARVLALLTPAQFEDLVGVAVSREQAEQLRQATEQAGVSGEPAPNKARARRRSRPQEPCMAQERRRAPAPGAKEGAQGSAKPESGKKGSVPR